MNELPGQAADIASSAYQYRADRKADDNPPESWLALMRYADLPFNAPVDLSVPKIKQVLCALLWEEIRPVERLELIWSANARRQPTPGEVAVTTLDNRGTASSWWNNLDAARKAVTPVVSEDGTTYAYRLQTPTCGVVLGVDGAGSASDYAVPAVRVLVAETWKRMEVEIEWGFNKSSAEKDYSGRIET